MQLETPNATITGFQPVSITLTIENADELRWLYHVANQQAEEMVKGYVGNNKGDFETRFVPFTAPAKRDLLHFVRSVANDQDVVIHQ